MNRIAKEDALVRDWVGRLLAKWRARTVLPHVEGKLLDVGCGLNFLVRRYGKGVGVDVYPWGDVDVLVDHVSALPFSDASFDTITIIAALNHIPDRIAVLREAWRVLRPGGRLIVTMIPPRIARFWHSLRKPWDADQRERGMTPGERYGLAKWEVRSLLESCGFMVCFQRRFMFGVNRLTVAQKVITQACRRGIGTPDCTSRSSDISGPRVSLHHPAESRFPSSQETILESR